MSKSAGINLARRKLLAAGLGTTVASLLPWRVQAATSGQHLIAPARFGQQYVLARFDERLGTDLDTGMPFRGHDLKFDPLNHNRVLIIERRPGTRVLEVDLAAGKISNVWHSEENRHFYGHACFSRDGKTVFITENDIDSGDGLLSVRDARDFSVLDEYMTHGIGPHELLLMPDGVTMAVANGGVLTFPETGRVKLNRGRIVSSLAYIDIRDGNLLDKFVVPIPQMSLRHLAITPDGQVGGAMQYEGNRKEGQPLMVFHKGETELQVAVAPQPSWDRMANYAASIAYDEHSQCFAFTCPKGDTTAFWKADRSFKGELTLAKASGVAFEQGHGYISNELGEIYHVDMTTLKANLHAHHPGLEWDNHLYLVRETA